ncbi:FtsW/RodA/SpoVE family cell cycle protein [Aneurinibacillus sp. Ricciae_BoGa-3]|uniref:FtsW/RodA/SpoVE family cell cycle protein n=1 Tax=Aneurinibacillus sp. Ricciae_BoGa-3 TaxID=3022697 RepID=UPI00234160BC|nr:FtsW/RodA/SpoVE family cell cycle protein [Aneurinibacillus sp. Ricciae_BoGa-3]WCK53391.1 FtsW/RodA/SpoVE family cell cycle protein [Aneurinibacillus sp. Ricciae_BoGa-3]
MVLPLIGISILSTLAIYSATVNRAGIENQYKSEIIWQVLSYISLIVFTFFNYRNLKNQLSWIGYFVTILLLLVVFAFPAKNGAHSWITLPGFQFQPSEFAKLFLILTISDYMEKAKEKGETFGFKHGFVILSVMFVPFALTLAQPALGQALVMLGITGAMMILFLERKQLAVFLIILAILTGFIFTIRTIFPDQSVHFINNLPVMKHQKQRIITFIDPNADPKGIGYQVTQGITAVGSGQLFGRGFANAGQTQGNWVPEQWTDFIFSAIGEEFGFIGSSLLLFLFFFLLYRMIQLGLNAPDYFSAYYIAGVVGMFAFQIIENVGMNLAIMPVAGITLPFVSYGGTSLLTNFILVGIVLSIGIRRKKLSF